VRVERHQEPFRIVREASPRINRPLTPALSLAPRPRILWGPLPAGEGELVFPGSAPPMLTLQFLWGARKITPACVLGWGRKDGGEENPPREPPDPPFARGEKFRWRAAHIVRSPG
jgi:hypothetical protein